MCCKCLTNLTLLQSFHSVESQRNDLVSFIDIERNMVSEYSTLQNILWSDFNGREKNGCLCTENSFQETMIIWG